MFLDSTIIAPFFQANSFVIKDTDSEGVNELYKQIDNIIYQKTKVVADAQASNNNATLRFYACCLFAYLVAGKSKIEELEMNRRKQLYTDAMAELEKIYLGESSIIDADGEDITAPIEKASSAAFTSTRRITSML